MKGKALQKFIKQLSELKAGELLNLYVEAKTGKHTDIDKIPVRIIESFEDLDGVLSEICADNIIGNTFTNSEPET